MSCGTSFAYSGGGSSISKTMPGRTRGEAFSSGSPSRFTYPLSMNDGMRERERPAACASHTSTRSGGASSGTV